MQIWNVGNLLYLTSYEGVILRMNPRDGKTETLASSRRRPALTILDDVEPKMITRVFAGPKNALCAATNDSIYAFLWVLFQRKNRPGSLGVKAFPPAPAPDQPLPVELLKARAFSSGFICVTPYGLAVSSPSALGVYFVLVPPPAELMTAGKP